MKAGTPNPSVSLFVWDEAVSVSWPVVPPAEVEAWQEHIYTAAGWSESGQLTVTW